MHYRGRRRQQYASSTPLPQPILSFHEACKTLRCCRRAARRSRRPVRMIFLLLTVAHAYGALHGVRGPPGKNHIRVSFDVDTHSETIGQTTPSHQSATPSAVLCFSLVVRTPTQLLLLARPMRDSIQMKRLMMSCSTQRDTQSSSSSHHGSPCAEAVFVCVRTGHLCLPTASCRHITLTHQVDVKCSKDVFVGADAVVPATHDHLQGTNKGARHTHKFENACLVCADPGFAISHMPGQLRVSSMHT